MNLKQKTIVIRVLMGLLFYNFHALAAIQLFAYSRFLYAFIRFGYPDWTRFFMATTEIVGVLLLIGTKTRPYGVGALAVLVAGLAASFVAAGFTLATVPTVAMFGLLVALAYVSTKTLA